MATIKLDLSKTALLMADFSTDGIGQNPIAKERHTLERAREVLDAARKAGIFVAYCVSHFRPGYPELTARRKSARETTAAGRVQPADPRALIHATVQPQEGEPVVGKHRTSAFYGSDMEMILRSQGIDTLILMGHSTSGVILSSVCYCSDADYQLIVVEDGCADAVPEVHKMLMEKYFPRRATVVSSKEVVEALATS